MYQELVTWDEILKQLKHNLEQGHNRIKHRDDAHWREETYNIGSTVFLCQITLVQFFSRLTKSWPVIISGLIKWLNMWKPALPEYSKVHPIFRDSTLRRKLGDSAQPIMSFPLFWQRGSQHLSLSSSKIRNGWNRDPNMWQRRSSSGNFFHQRMQHGMTLISLFKNFHRYTFRTRFQLKGRRMIGHGDYWSQIADIWISKGVEACMKPHDDDHRNGLCYALFVEAKTEEMRKLQLMDVVPT